MGTLSASVSGERDIDLPKHLAPPDPWPSEGVGRGGGERTVIRRQTVCGITRETRELVAGFVGVDNKQNKKQKCSQLKHMWSLLYVFLSIQMLFS